MRATLPSERIGRRGENRVEETVMATAHLWRRQPDKSPGIDGIIEIFKRGKATGGIIYVQVKSGESHIERETEDTYVIGVDKQDTQYWRQSQVPVILVFCVEIRNRVRLFWVHINQKTTSQEGWVVYVPKTSKFGSHSSRELYLLSAKYHGCLDSLPIIDRPHGPPIPVSSIKSGCWEFYSKWRESPAVSPAFGSVRITSRGWRHLTANWRTQASIIRRLELLGAAKEILCTLDQRHKCRECFADENGKTIKPEFYVQNGRMTKREFYIQTALVHYSDRADVVVSVVTERVNNGPFTFYSVYEDWGKCAGGKAVHHG